MRMSRRGYLNAPIATEERTYYTVVGANNAGVRAQLFQIQGDVITPTENLVHQPPGPCLAVSITPDAKYMAAVVSGQAPYVSTYSRSRDTLTQIELDTPASTLSRVCAMAADGTLAILANNMPSLVMYKPEAGKFVRMPVPTFNFWGRTLTISQSGDYLAVDCGSKEFRTFKRTVDGYVAMAIPASFPMITCNAMALSGNGDRLVIGCDTSNQFYTYTRDGDAYKSKGSMSLTRQSKVVSLSMTADGMYIAMVFEANPFLVPEVHRWDGSHYIRVKQFGSDASYTKCSFSPDGRYLSFIRNNAPWHAVFRRDGDDFVSLTLPQTEVQYASACAFSNVVTR